MDCMIPDPFPSIAFGKGSTTPDYICSRCINYLEKICFIKHQAHLVRVVCLFVCLFTCLFIYLFIY